MNKYFNYRFYNDYELIYLVKDGDENALNVLFYKYERIAAKIIKSYIFDNIYFEDLVQEGRIVLYNCIYKYDESSTLSFYSFFIISFKRRLARLIVEQTYGKSIHVNEIYLSQLSDGYTKKNKSYLVSGDAYFTDDIYIELFNECLIRNVKLSVFAREHNMDYNKVHYMYNKMIAELKKILK